MREVVFGILFCFATTYDFDDTAGLAELVLFILWLCERENEIA